MPQGPAAPTRSPGGCCACRDVWPHEDQALCLEQNGTPLTQRIRRRLVADESDGGAQRRDGKASLCPSGVVWRVSCPVANGWSGGYLLRPGRKTNLFHLLARACILENRPGPTILTRTLIAAPMRIRQSNSRARRDHQRQRMMSNASSGRLETRIEPLDWPT